MNFMGNYQIRNTNPNNMNDKPQENTERDSNKKIEVPFKNVNFGVEIGKETCQQLSQIKYD